jgi:hypothetical protein
MNRILSLGCMFALAFGAACKERSDDVKPGNAKAPAPKDGAKRKTPHEKAVEQVLALDAVVKKYTKLVADAEGAGEFEKAAELRTRLNVAQNAYEDARTRLEMMDKVSPMLHEEERRKQQSDGGAAATP